MRFQVIHKTAYRYTNGVSVSHHVARLTPRSLPRQTVLSHSLAIDPVPALRADHDDYYGNRVAFFILEGKHQTLSVTAASEVEVQPFAPPPETPTAPWERVRDGLNSAALAPDIVEFALPSPIIPRLPALADYAAESFPPERPLLEGVLDLTRRAHEDFKFDPKATTVATPLEQVIRQRRGVCQDFAHFEIGCLRALGLPARYVSGYLETRPPPGKVKLVGADASHAWVQVFMPPLGWIDVDPTNNLIPSDRHITLAYGRDFDDVSPIRGVLVGSGKHQLAVGVDVIPG